jgi:hypothetical protein
VRLTAPRLALAPARDDDLEELAWLARFGIHSPDLSPFSNLWTDRADEAFTGAYDYNRRRFACRRSWAMSQTAYVPTTFAAVAPRRGSTG